MNRAHAPEPRVEDDDTPDTTPVGGVDLNGTLRDVAPQGASTMSRTPDGHALIHVNGVTVDPRTIEGLVGAGITVNPALSFSHVTLTQRDQNGMHILVLNGVIENGTGVDASVPPIRADFLAGDRVLASILVEPPTRMLGIGESRGFMARLPHPGGKTPDVRLSFMPQGASAPRV